MSAQDTAPAELIQSANKFSKKLSGGYEVETNRKIVSVPIFSPNGEQQTSGHMVFYKIEGHAGTEAYHQWAALFSKNQKGEIEINQFALIGNSGWRHVELDRVNLSDNKLVAPYKLWKKSDKACCPTGSGIGNINFNIEEIVFLE